MNNNFTFVNNIYERNDFKKQVPDMISSKDLSYIEDMLNWNYFAAKETFHYSDCVENELIIDILDKCYKMHKTHFEELLNRLGGNNE